MNEQTVAALENDRYSRIYNERFAGRDSDIALNEKRGAGRSPQPRYIAAGNDGFCKNQ